MDATDSVDSSSKDDLPLEQQLENLAQQLQEAHDKNSEMQDKLLDITAENSKFLQKLERLNHENQQLRQPPLFIATVQEVSKEGIIIRQHGNNQEAITVSLPELHDEIKSGSRVAVNSALSIIHILDEETDLRAQAMQIDDCPTVTYDDIGGLDDQIQQIREAVEIPLENPEIFKIVGVEPPAGVLLHGPPGTGKTLLAKAVANKTNASFIKLAGSELVHKFIGEGSRLVRDIFQLALANEPAIIFIDEVDAIASQRIESKTSGDAEVQRTMMQLLASLDGFDERGNIRLIAATNRFDMLDEAILRPGRFDRLIEIPFPNEEARERIFAIHTQNMNLADKIDFKLLSELTPGSSGADIKAICTEAGMTAIREERTEISADDFITAVNLLTTDKSKSDDSESVIYA
ncbi:MAG TPA: proteasome-activating nucleotidase [Halobacteriales archaeon]|nr:proteasome-activating nucleotidase [Halobacteriales archaeon]|tara:strand:+ start:143807 stop:145021 length:1215 start_codon:yes stop_codon:yes gene_type:complete